MKVSFNKKYMEKLPVICYIPLVFLLLFIPGNVFSIPSDYWYEASVLRIIDSVTLEIRITTLSDTGRMYGLRNENTGTPFLIRLIGIETPEQDQPFYSDALDLFTSLVNNATIYVREYGSDNYARHVSLVYTTNYDIGEEMIRRGLAWAWQDTSLPIFERYRTLQNEARAARVGLWSDTNPISPREWRIMHGRQ